ncbi:single-stranded-DNA-specific exonuclease RecJ [Robertmurraya sp.]|uniref:single-stranded-DNA-specific exonuclease RecJ n=1 Tax=Robertmurraya sp. TaxID=2837525 RepID=UPI0037041857
MLKPKSRWSVQQHKSEDDVKELCSELKISPLVASLLVRRGLNTASLAKKFLYEHEEQCHDPYLLTGMDIAVNRIHQAIENQEPILIFGDYDADGVTSTSVMMLTLKELGAIVDFYIPNRFTEGYGPNEPAFRHAHESGVKLIITVDTGISAVHEASVLKSLGVDLIITDHHEPGPILPEALAIIHPKLPGSTYPFKELAGVGVAFKLSQALLGQLPEHLLEFVAIGTIADLVPLVDENRYLVKRGLKKIRSSSRTGIKALCKQAGIEQQTIDEETIGFTIGPRINAVGRLDSADSAVHLLLSEDLDEAEMLAEEIDSYNKERQRIVSSIADEAIQQVNDFYPIEENSVIVVGQEGWNAGVVGIVASRLVEAFYRPTIVLSFDREKGIAKGSARSIEGFDLFKNLSTCREILPHFGGHPMAAGMTLKLEDVDELRTRLNELAVNQLSEEDFIPLTVVDLEMSIKDVQLNALEELQLLSPFGTSNKKPKILLRDANISQIKKIGANQSHLKLTLEHEGAILDGIGFHLGEKVDHISPQSKLSVVGELSINEWNNIRKPQIFLHDLAINEWQLFDYRGIKQVGKLKEMVPTSKWISFNNQISEKIKQALSDRLHLIETVEQARNIDIDEQFVVLYDLPTSKELLTSLLNGKKPARIYAHFYKEASDFFSTIPTRDHFKWYYAFLSKKAPFDLKKYGDELAKYRGWSRETIDFMSQVFFELDFVKINNGFITLNTSSHKRDLTSSKTYQKKQEDLALEQELLYSSYQVLHSWLDECIRGSVEIEEEVK